MDPSLHREMTSKLSYAKANPREKPEANGWFGIHHAASNQDKLLASALAPWSETGRKPTVRFWGTRGDPSGTAWVIRLLHQFRVALAAHFENTGRHNLLFHTMVGSNDIERSKRFYNAVLGALGHDEAMLNMAGSGHTRLFYRKAGGTNFIVTQPINGEPATVANGSTVAFSCNSPEQVQQFHDVAVANGGTSIEDLPGPRETAMGTVHLAYVRDPDGNKLCGIHIPV